MSTTENSNTSKSVNRKTASSLGELNLREDPDRSCLEVAKASVLPYDEILEEKPPKRASYTEPSHDSDNDSTTPLAPVLVRCDPALYRPPNHDDRRIFNFLGTLPVMDFPNGEEPFARPVTQPGLPPQPVEYSKEAARMHGAINVPDVTSKREYMIALRELLKTETEIRNTMKLPTKAELEEVLADFTLAESEHPLPKGASQHLVVLQAAANISFLYYIALRLYMLYFPLAAKNIYHELCYVDVLGISFTAITAFYTSIYTRLYRTHRRRYLPPITRAKLGKGTFSTKPPHQALALALALLPQVVDSAPTEDFTPSPNWLALILFVLAPIIVVSQILKYSKGTIRVTPVALSVLFTACLPYAAADDHSQRPIVSNICPLICLMATWLYSSIDFKKVAGFATKSFNAYVASRSKKNDVSTVNDIEEAIKYARTQIPNLDANDADVPPDFRAHFASFRFGFKLWSMVRMTAFTMFISPINTVALVLDVIFGVPIYKSFRENGWHTPDFIRTSDGGGGIAMSDLILGNIPILGMFVKSQDSFVSLLMILLNTPKFPENQKRKKVIYWMAFLDLVLKSINNSLVKRKLSMILQEFVFLPGPAHSGMSGNDSILDDADEIEFIELPPWLSNISGVLTGVIDLTESNTTRHLSTLMSVVLTLPMMKHVETSEDTSRLLRLAGIKLNGDFTLRNAISAGLFFVHMGFYASVVGVKRAFEYMEYGDERMYNTCIKLSIEEVAGTERISSGINQQAIGVFYEVTRKKLVQSQATARTKAEKLRYTTMIADIEKIQVLHRKSLARTGKRFRAIGIGLTGPSNTGKSTCIPVISKLIHAKLGLSKYAKRVILSMGDAYDSNLFEDVTDIWCDDMNNLKEKYKVHPGSDKVIRFCSEVPEPIVKAEAEQKGKFLLNNLIFGGTSNDPFLGLNEETRCMPSMANRFTMLIRVEHRPRYVDEDGALHHVNVEKDFPDYDNSTLPPWAVYSFYVWREDDTKAAYCDDIPGKTNLSARDALNEIGRIVDNYISRMKRIDGLKSKQDTSSCSHNMPGTSCSICFPHLNGNDTLLQSAKDILYDTAALLTGSNIPAPPTVPSDPTSLSYLIGAWLLTNGMSDDMITSMEFLTSNLFLMIQAVVLAAWCSFLLIPKTLVEEIVTENSLLVMSIKVELEPFVETMVTDLTANRWWILVPILFATFSCFLHFFARRVLAAATRSSHDVMFEVIRYRSEVLKSTAARGVFATAAILSSPKLLKAACSQMEIMLNGNDKTASDLKFVPVDPKPVLERKEELKEVKNKYVQLEKAKIIPSILGKGATEEQIVPLLKRAMYRIHGRFFDGSEKLINGFFMDTGCLLTTKHFFTVKKGSETVRATSIDVNLATHGMETPILGKLDYDPDVPTKSDFSAFYVHNPTGVRSLWKYFSTKRITAPTTATILWMDPSTLEVISERIYVTPRRVEYNVRGQTWELEHGLAYKTSRQFDPNGHCMCPIYTTEGGFTIIGFHIAGSKDSNERAGFTVTMDEMAEMRRHLRDTTPYITPGDYVGVNSKMLDKAAVETDVLHAKNPMNWMPGQQHAFIHKVFEKTFTPRNHLEANPYGAEFTNITGEKSTKVPPPFKANPPMRKVVHIASAPPCKIDHDLAMEAVDDYVGSATDWVEQAEQTIKVTRRPFTLEEVMNGVDGNPYIRSMDGSKSAGPILNCAKKNYMDISEDGKTRSFTPETHTAYLEYQTRLMSGLHSGEFTEAFLKGGEPLPPEKDMARLIFNNSMFNLVLCKCLFGPILSVILACRNKNELALGLDPTGVDWHEITRGFFEPDGDETGEPIKNNVSIDYSMYDNTQGDMRSYVFQVYERIGVALKYTKPYLQLMERLYEEFFHPLISFNGAVVCVPGLLTSGGYLTSSGGSINNVLSVRYSLFKHIPKQIRLPGGFRDYVYMRALGDDNWMRWKAALMAQQDKWNVERLASDLEELGLIITSSDKESDIVMDYPHKQVFLQRETMFAEIVNRRVGLLKEESAAKPFCWWVPSDNQELQMISIIMGRLHEKYYLPDYPRHLEEMRVFCERSGLPSGWLSDFSPEDMELTHPSCDFDSLPTDLIANDGDEVENDSQGVTTFISPDATEEVTGDVPYSRDLTDLPIMPEGALGAWMERTTLIATINVNENITLRESFDPYTLHTTHPAILEKLKHTALFAADIELRFKITASAGHYGQMIAVVTPRPQDTPAVLFDNNFRAELWPLAATQRQHVRMNVGGDTEYKLIVPYVSHNPMTRFDLDEVSKLAVVNVFTTAALQHTLDETMGAVVQVFATFKNYTFTGTTLQANMKIITPMEKPSDVATAIQKVSAAAATALMIAAPQYAAPAEALSLLSGKAASLARSVGHSRPLELGANLTVPSLDGGLSNANANIPSKKVSVDALQGVSMGSEIAGFQQGDGMGMEKFVGVYDQIATKVWSSTDAIGTDLFLIPVTPIIQASGGGGQFMFPRCSVPALFHSKWRGPMIYRFSIVSSSSLSGAITAYYEPNPVQGMGWDRTIQENVQFDIRESESLELTVHHAQQEAALMTNSQGELATAFYDNAGSTNGMVAVRVTAPLKGMRDTPFKVTIMLEAMIDDRMFFYAPANQLMLGYYLKNPISHTVSATGGGHAGLFTDINPTGQASQSGNVFSACCDTGTGFAAPPAEEPVSTPAPTEQQSFPPTSMVPSLRPVTMPPTARPTSLVPTMYPTTTAPTAVCSTELTTLPAFALSGHVSSPAERDDGDGYRLMLHGIQSGGRNSINFPVFGDSSMLPDNEIIFVGDFTNLSNPTCELGIVTHTDTTMTIRVAPPYNFTYDQLKWISFDVSEGPVFVDGVSITGAAGTQWKLFKGTDDLPPVTVTDIFGEEIQAGLLSPGEEFPVAADQTLGFTGPCANGRSPVQVAYSGSTNVGSTGLPRIKHVDYNPANGPFTLTTTDTANVVYVALKVDAGARRLEANDGDMPTQNATHEFGNHLDNTFVIRGYAGENIMSFRSLLKVFSIAGKYEITQPDGITLKTPIFSLPMSEYQISLRSFLTKSYLGSRGSTVSHYVTSGNGFLMAFRHANVMSDPGQESSMEFGVEMGDSRINPTLTVSYPYQSRFRFQYNNGQGLDPEPTLMKGIHMQPSVNSTMRVYEYTSIGEDFDLVHFCGTPVLYKR